MSMSHHEDNSVPRLMPLLLLSVTFLGVMGVSVILPVLPKITEVFRLSPSEAGLLIACFTLPSAFLTPVAGVLADRFGRSAVMLPGLCLFAVGGMGCALSSSLTQLLLFRAVQGLGAAPLGILYGTLVGDAYPEERRPHMMGVVGATISLATACYPFIGGLLGELHWSYPFWLSLLALPVAVLALRVPLVGPRRGMDWRAYARDSRSIIFHPATIGLFSLTFLCFCILYGPTITYVPMLAHELYGASPARIGGVFTLASLGTALIALNLARLGSFFGHRGLLFVAAGCYLIAQGLMLALPPLGTSCWILTLPVFLGGVAQGLTFPLLTSRMTSLAPTRNRAIVMAMNGTVLRLSQSAAPLLFGFGWAVAGWRGPYMMGVGAALLIGLLVWLVYPKNGE